MLGMSFRREIYQPTWETSACTQLSPESSCRLWVRNAAFIKLLPTCPTVQSTSAVLSTNALHILTASPISILNPPGNGCLITVDTRQKFLAYQTAIKVFLRKCLNAWAFLSRIFLTWKLIETWLIKKFQYSYFCCEMIVSVISNQQFLK